MKYLNFRINKIKIFLSALLALIGFTGCDIFTGKEEYGCPHADLNVNGIVKSKDGAAIDGIQTIIEERHTEFRPDIVDRDTVYTDSEGRYVLRKEFISLQKLKITFKDIDGEKNGGEFAESALYINENDWEQIKKGSGWYSGEFMAKKDVTLEKKSNE